MIEPLPPRKDPVAEFAERLRESLAQGTFVRIVLSPAVTSPDTPEKVLGRLIAIGGKPFLSLTYRYSTRDEVENLPVAESAGWILERIGTRYSGALLGTTRHDWQLTFSGAHPRLIRHKPSVTVAPSREHDQPRRTLLDGTAADWLRGLGVLDGAGKVRPQMSDKYTQINRYLEIFSHLASEAGWLKPGGNPDTGDWTTVDMGCGKGYLTFGLWHLLVRVLNLPVQIIGVEEREALVGATRALAQKIGAERLTFIQGTVGDTKLPKARALIALHACDTAIDDAIRRGIEMEAELIVVAPCCHKQVRPQLGRPDPLAPILHHGLMAERMAEWVTDGLRALFLEWAGYRTKIFEFVSVEHTAKNVMISAVRDRSAGSDPRVKAEILELKRFFGLGPLALDPLLT